MLIAHLSDLHLSAGPPETEPVRRDVADIVALVVEDILRLPQRPDAVVITGDVADGGSPEDYALVRRILSPLPMPVLAVPGNHDQRKPMRAAFGCSQDFADPTDLRFETALGDIRILGLDSVLPGRVEGELRAEQLDWLEARLADASPAVVLLHHPPFLSGNGHWDATALVRGGERLKLILAASRAPARLLCGHVHQAFHTVWAGGYAAVGGSPAFQYSLALGKTEEPLLCNDPYVYALHHRRADGSFGVHPRTLVLPPRIDLADPPRRSKTSVISP